MAASQFLMQIVDSSTGETISYGPGSRVEQDFAADCARRILAGLKELPTIDTVAFKEACAEAIRKRGVGFLKTEDHVMRDVMDGLNEAIANGGLNSASEALRTNVRDIVEVCIASSILDLKRQITPST